MESDLRCNESTPSRRSFLQLGVAGPAVLASGILGESFFAASVRAASLPRGPFPKDAVIIDANENPLGPCSVAREAIAEISGDCGRYSFWLTEDLAKRFAAQEGLKPEYVRPFPGSGEPLHFSVLAFTSPSRSYVTADPGYEAGMHAAKISGARVVKTALTSTYAHDVKAMLAAAPDAGLFYVCTPNNPTGTLTPHADIEYLVERKPAGAVVLVDEAYIHFSDGTSALDLVRADKDVVVLRTFSKIYGMAGLRCGYCVTQKETIDRLRRNQMWDSVNCMALAAATASLDDLDHVPNGQRLNREAKTFVTAEIEKMGYKQIPSQANFIMFDVKRPVVPLIKALKERNVQVGRLFPALPNHMRLTIGKKTEMEAFLSAFRQVV